jgi:hypothetical protein
MKSPGFSFKTEPIWMLTFSLAPAVVAILIALLISIVKLAR